MQLTPESHAHPEDPFLPNDGSSLPSAVITAAVALLFALGAVLWLGLRNERRQLIEQAYAAADRSAIQLALNANDVIERADKALQVVKSLRENANPLKLETLSRDRVTSEEVASGFLVTDRTGMVVESTSPDLVVSLGENHDFQRMVRGEEPGLVIGTPAQDHVRGGWVIPMMRRLDGPQGFDGVVLALLRPQALVQGSGEESGDGLTRTIVGTDGLIRARMLDGQLQFEAQGPGARTAIPGLQAQRAELRFAIDPDDGEPIVAAEAALAGHELLAVASSPADAVEAAYVEARDRTLAWGSAAALLLVTGAIMLWQQACQLEASRRAARRANALYVATLEGSLDALFLMDPVHDAAGEIVDFVVSEANRRSLDMVKLDREQVIGRRLCELLPTSKHDGLLKLLARVHRTGRAIDVEAPGSAEPVLGRWLHLQAVPAAESVALITRDITERRDAAVQLAERETLMRTLLDALPLAVYATSARVADHGEVRFWNKAAERQYGLTAEQAIGSTLHAHMPGIATQAILQDTEIAREKRVMAFPEIVHETGSGTRYLDFLKAPVLDAAGEVDMILAISEDVTDQRAAAEQLRLVSRIVQETGDAVLLTDRLGHIVLANAAFAKITGRTPGSLLGASAQEIGLPALRDSALAGVEQALRDHRHWAGESTLPRREGKAVESWLNLSAIVDPGGTTTHHAWLFSDISVLKAQERQLAELARRDALTQLSNRRHFEETLEAATARARRQGHALALIYLDLDGFKQINDTLGHEAGDRLLIEAAQRLRNTVRSTDLVSRLGGDEFTVILEHAGSEDDRALQCQRLLDELSRPYLLGGQKIVCTPSIGIAGYRDGEHIESLRHRADAAMYEAKRSGKGKVRTAELLPA